MQYKERKLGLVVEYVHDITHLYVWNETAQLSDPQGSQISRKTAPENQKLARLITFFNSKYYFRYSTT